MAGLKINICFWYVDKSIIEEIVEILKEGNYDPEYTLCKDAGDVKKKIVSGLTDLIISDFDLPDTLRTSIEQVHRSTGEDVPLIYLVGEKNELKAAETLKKGVWDYLLKSQFTKLVSTVYSSQKFGKVLKDSKVAYKEKERQEILSKILVKYIDDPVIIINAEWDILFANASAAERLELPSSTFEEILELLRSSILDQSGKPHAEVLKLINRAVALEDQQFYAGFKGPDGEITPGLVNIKSLESKEIGESLTIITFRDMTEVRKIEQELSDSESKYLSIFNAVQDGMLLIDPKSMEIVDNNPRIEEMFAFDPNKSRQDNISDLETGSYGFDAKSLEKAVKKLSDKDPLSYLYLNEISGKDGFWTENTLTRFKFGEKSMIVLVIRNIHEQRLMEVNLKESKEHFQNLAENSPDVIMRFDKNHRHLYVNQTVEQQLGMKVESFINKSHAEMGGFPEDKVEQWEAALETVFKKGESHTVEFDLDTGDHVLYYEWRLFPERSDTGEIDTVLAIARDITATREADISIKVSEERLQLAVQATSLGLWDWNIITSEVYFSSIWSEMLGYGTDELTQVIETWQNLLHIEDKEATLELVDRSIENRDEGFEADFRLLCKDGKYKWVKSKGRAVQFDEEGNTTRMAGTHEDIEERKRNENIQTTLYNISNAVNTSKDLQELYEKIQEHLSLVVDTTNCFLAIYHEDTNTLSLPFLRDEKDSFSKFPAKKTLTGYVIKTGKAQLIDVEKEKELTRLGEIEPVGTPGVSWLGVPLKIKNKIIGVYVIQSYTEDVVYTEEDVHILEFVSDQIATAIERKRDQDRLRDNQEKQRRIFESSPDPIIVVDKNALIIDYNSALLEELNISNEPIVGQNVFHFIDKKFWRKAIESFNQTWEEGYIKNLEFLVHTVDGSRFEAEVATGAMYTQKGEPDSMVIMIKNIQERKEAERNLTEAKEKAEEADRLKTAFLSNMSHEIRTPMNAIVGFSDLLSDKSVSEDDRNEFIAQINLGADNLMHLIDDIIDISKIEAGQIQVINSDCNINELVNEQLVMFQENLGRLDKSHLDLRLNWQWPNESLTVNTDPFRVKQIISNLINNAIKFTDTGFVELGVQKQNKSVYFYIKDSGIGIDKDKQSIIFDRFRQGHVSKAKLYGGTGLGLAISRNLTHLLGGEIGVSSEKGKGSEFWFTLPADIVKIGVKRTIKAKNTSSRNWKGKNILVAEDDYSNFLLISESLKGTNAEIIWAKDGRETMDIFKERGEDIHLILMDIHMPILSGYDCTREIKKEKPDLPIIAQTAYAMSGERELSFEAGCDDYISKPIQVDQLLEMIGSYIS